MKALKGLFRFLFSCITVWFRLIKHPLAVAGGILVFFGIFWACGIPPQEMPAWVQSHALPRFYARMKELRHESLFTAGKILETSSPAASGVIKALDKKLSGEEPEPEQTAQKEQGEGSALEAVFEGVSANDPTAATLQNEYRSFEEIAREAERKAEEEEAAYREYRANEDAWSNVIGQVQTVVVEKDPFADVPPETVFEGKAVVRGGASLNVAGRPVELNVRIRSGSAGRAFQALQREADGKTVRCAPCKDKYRCLAGKTDLGQLLVGNSLADSL